MNKEFKTAKARQLTKRSPNGNSYIFTRDVPIKAKTQADEDWMLTLTTKTGNNLLVWVNMPETVKEIADQKPNRVKIIDLPGDNTPRFLPEFHASRTEKQIEAELALAEMWEARRLEENPLPEKELSDADKLHILKQEMEDLLEENEGLAERVLQLELETENYKSVIAEMDEKLLFYSLNVASEDVVSEETEEAVQEDEVIVVPEIPYTEDTQFFIDKFNEMESEDSFIEDMKQEFNVSSLTDIANELGMEYEGTKAEMIMKLMEKVSN
jgi:hypothetical protein